MVPSSLTRPQRLSRLVAAWLPDGDSLDPDVWARRHRLVVRLLLAHAVVLTAIGAITEGSLPHTLTDGALLLVPALLAVRLPSRWARSAAAAVGLLVASSMVVHLAGGATEAHFHFFVMMVVVTLYEDWRPYLLALAYVVLHHGLLGSLAPEELYNTLSAQQNGIRTAAVHAAFIVTAGVANVVAWRVREDDHERWAATERRRADEALERLAALVDSTDDAIVGTTADGTVTTWNPGAERLFGRPPETMLGRDVATLVPPELIAQERERFGKVLAEERLDHYETRWLHADGTEIHVSLALSIVRDPAGGIIGMSAIARDVSERRRRDLERRAYTERLKAMALEDQLTGLGNYRRFHEALDREVARCERNDGVFSVLLFDLDGFKRVNDTQGHAAGDRVLARVAGVMRERSRTADLAVRLGGDEFALLLPDTDAAGARVLGARVQDGVRALDEGVDASWGVGTWPEDGPGKDRVLARADAGLYAAKPGSQRAAPPFVATTTRLAAASAIRPILETARAQLGLDVALLSEFKDGDQVFRATAGDTDAFGLGSRVPLADTYCQRVVDGRLPNIVLDAEHDPRVSDLPGTRDGGIRAYIGVPVLLGDGDLYGMICCLSKQRDPALAERDVQFLTMLATVAAQQLERERATDAAQRRRAEEVSVEALLAALEARDRYTGQHSETVVALAEAVARRLALDEEEVERVGRVALLHDIGKLGIPDGVLQKQGPLDAEEWQIMRRHPALGAEIVASIPSTAHLAPAIRGEHERWDGGGYPDGLAGEDIPLASRITFVCDAYHAMTSDRPYRKGMDEDRARAELGANAGTQFDPEVVSALLAVLEAPAGLPAPARA